MAIQAGDDRNSVSRAGRSLVRHARSAALATILEKQGGHPYASLVTVACDMDASPIMLFSELADHTRNLMVNGQASLLFEAASRRRNPQTGPRVTLCGTINKVQEKRLSDRFLAHHPDAELYSGFDDFAFYKMSVERAHWVGGFAKARWQGAKQFMFGDAAAIGAITDAEPHVIGHMNADHGDALDACVRAFAGRRGSGWNMVGLDPEGMSLRLGGRFARLDFDRPVADAEDCRRTLVQMAKQARKLLAK